MSKKSNPATKGRDKVKPDEGQGSKGNFGTDGDWGKSPDDEKKKSKQSSPVPVPQKEDS
jgi:hypothetical protein